ncbi:hypothetical protein Pcinc_036088 [Petrolisthes cinctipes]|uniref:Uncharacterized protein n=1 Tax=Petrolisthes cinctipes TaxID=88211 RepID=A0AAE1BV87_PETCI|nr:hypothetical protein Pcinc_036088 [Petrolisthes cinctipes]
MQQVVSAVCQPRQRVRLESWGGSRQSPPRAGRLLLRPPLMSGSAWPECGGPPHRLWSHSTGFRKVASVLAVGRAE